MPFQVKIQKARFVYSPFSAEQMLQIGNVLRDSIATRIMRAVNVNDQAARPLKPGRNGRAGYPEQKERFGLKPIRDWVGLPGRMRTIGSMKVTSVSENRGRIGFVDEKADMIAHINNLREKQFGVSPKDRQALGAIVRAMIQEGRATLVMTKRVG